MTMNFEFKCPQCKKSVEADETYSGQVAQCPHCGKGIVIPRTNKAKPEDQRQETKPVHIHCPHCGTENEVTRQDLNHRIACEMCGKVFVAGSPMGKKIGHGMEPGRHPARKQSDDRFVCVGLCALPVRQTGESSKQGSGSNRGPSGLKNSDETKSPAEEVKQQLSPEEKEEERQRKLKKVHICTKCGGVVMLSSKDAGLMMGMCGCGFWLVFIPLSLLLLMIGALPAPICIAMGLLFFIFGLIAICVGFVTRTVCPHCRSRNTLIPGTSPQGMQLFRESRKDADAPNPPTQIPTPPPKRPTAPVSQDVSERLNKVRKLLDSGLITAEEYESQRKRILESI